MAESKSIKVQRKTPKSKNDKGGKEFPVVSWVRAGLAFLQEAKQELRKVIWPPRRQILTSTGVVIILVFLAACYLGLVDYILSRIVRLVLGLGG